MVWTGLSRTVERKTAFMPVVGPETEPCGLASERSLAGIARLRFSLHCLQDRAGIGADCLMLPVLTRDTVK